MHVLTKIFVVLVALLAILLVPLVVVYAHNEDSYKAKFQDAEATAAVAMTALREAEVRYESEIARVESMKQRVAATNADLRSSIVNLQAEITRKDQQITAEQAMKAEIDAKLATLATSLDASQRLTESLVGEVRDLRTDVIGIEEQKIALDEALRDTSGQLEVAVQARRSLQEQVQRLKDELAYSTNQISEAIAQGFDPDSDDGTVNLAAVNLDARVVNVLRREGETLAEISSGSQDGLEVGNTLSVSRGGRFKGRLRIVNVDVRSATGIVELEDASKGRIVEVGDTAHARVGEE